MRLLLVEDDVKLVRVLWRGLVSEGYEVEIATTAEAALELAKVNGYDLVILDVMLPGADGFTFCEWLRTMDERVPVLMVTARGNVADRIRGLDAGADDYLVKPFDFGELLARVRALIRRSPAERPAAVEVGDLRVDPVGRVVTRAGGAVDLSPREFAVLEFLARHAGRVVSRTQLLEHVWTENGVSSNVVDVYVGYLRKKLEVPARPPLIRTIRGVGFILEPV
jgi:two-component system OmpR family response regulator